LVNKLGFSLCLVTNRSQVAGSLEGAVEACLEAGLKAVQLREKDLEVRDLLSWPAVCVSPPAVTGRGSS
jgi:Thiamine monophosphate synthase